MRLYNFLKDELNLTKSELKEYFSTHNVYVNDVLSSMLTIVDENSIIKSVFNKDQSIRYFKCIQKEYIYIAYNKPVGVLCSNDKLDPCSILNFIDCDTRIYPIGRLDKDSHGLIILTNDNKFTNLVLNKDNHVEKKYICRTREEIDDFFVKRLSKPILINNKYTKECLTRLIDNHTFEIVLREGMNRQIRKMALSLGKKVIDLKRISFGSYNLDLEENKYKFIKKEDII